MAQDVMADTVSLPSFRDYTVIARLGLGGFGTVYKAQHNYTKQLRAIKILPPGIQNEAVTLKQFQDEAQAMGAFDHPHIVKIYHAGIENGFPFLDMEFIEGESVHELIQEQVASGEKPMPVGEVIRLAREMADALRYIHTQNLIHRDIKPQNIMRRGTDKVFKLTDFGIAFESKLSTRSTDFAGTAEYMSPEQIEGDQLFPQTDIYSLGVVLYESLIGRPPFRSEGTNFASRLRLQQQILEKAPLKVHDFNTDAPDWFADIVMRCLEKKATNRFSSAQELMDSIDTGILTDKSVADMRLSDAERLVKENRYEEAVPVFQDAKRLYVKLSTYLAVSGMGDTVRSLIRQCDERLEFLSERGQKVRSLRERGTQLMGIQDYKGAIPFYQEVLGIYENDLDALKQIKRCEDGIREQEALRQSKIDLLRKQAEGAQKELRLREARQYWLELANVAPEFASEANQKAQAIQDELSRYWKTHFDKEREADNLVAEAQQKGFNEAYHKRIVELYKEAQHFAERGYEGDANVYRKRNNALQEKVGAANQLLTDFRRMIQETRSEADRLFAGGRYIEAKKRYQQLLAQSPGDKSLQERIVDCTNGEIRDLREKAGLLFAEENYEKAATLYRGLIELKPNDPEAKQRLVECENFIRINNQVRELQSQQVSLLIQTGDQLASVSSYKAALDKYNQALAIQPEHEGLRAKIESITPLVQPSSGQSRSLFGGLMRSTPKPAPVPKPVVAPKPTPVPPSKPQPVVAKPEPVVSAPEPVIPTLEPVIPKRESNSAPLNKAASESVATASKDASAPLPASAKTIETPSKSSAKPLSASSKPALAAKPSAAPKAATKPQPVVKQQAASEKPKKAFSEPKPIVPDVIDQEESGSNRWILIGAAGILLIGLIYIVVMDPFGWMGNKPVPNQVEVISDTEFKNSAGIELVKIPAGAFTMGDPNGDEDARPDHEVNITQPFWISKYEVTSKVFKRFQADTGYRTEAEQAESCQVYQNGEWVEDNTGTWKGFMSGDDRPAVCVSWNDAQAFVNWLNAKEGTTAYRLPTEAEWEYVARAGASTRYAFGSSPEILADYAWYSENAGNQPQIVGKKRANAWNVHDMHGNVYEWVSDWYNETYYQASPKQDPQGPSGGSDRVLRGGSWAYDADALIVSYRNSDVPTKRNTNIGFRIVKTQ